MVEMSFVLAAFSLKLLVIALVKSYSCYGNYTIGI